LINSPHNGTTRIDMSMKESSTSSEEKDIAYYHCVSWERESLL